MTEKLHSLNAATDFEKLMISEAVIVEQKRDYKKLLEKMDELVKVNSELLFEIRKLKAELNHQKSTNSGMARALAKYRND